MFILQIDTSYLNCSVTAGPSLINAIVFIPHQTAPDRVRFNHLPILELGLESGHRAGDYFPEIALNESELQDIVILGI